MSIPLTSEEEWIIRYWAMWSKGTAKGAMPNTVAVHCTQQWRPEVEPRGIAPKNHGALYDSLCRLEDYGFIKSECQDSGALPLHVPS